jgi:hypothetical protein
MHTELERSEALGRALRALPGEAGAPYEWCEFKRRARPRPQRLLTAHGPALAAAVLVAVAAGAATIRWAGPGSRPQAPPPARTATAHSEPAAPRHDDADAEHWLASLPDPAVVRVGTRAAVATLEDHIALVDDLLSAGRIERAPPARLLALQQERTQLVSSLAQVRYAETLADASR